MTFAQLAGSLLLPCLVASAQVPTQAQAKALAGQAVAYAKQNGVEKLILETNQAGGRFHGGTGGGLYLFVLDPAGLCRATSSETEALLGKNLMDRRDAGGKRYVREMIRVAKTNGKGWVDYKYLSPATGKVENRVAYVLWHKDVLIGAGYTRF